MADMGGRRHRWQLTSPLARLSRPIRSGARGEGDVAAGTGDGAGPHGDAAARDDRIVSGQTLTVEAPIPVVLGGALARQTDATTCASAVLVMLAATGDPGLARWLETGELPSGAETHEIPPEIPPDLPPDLDGAARFAAAQRHVKRATGRRALGAIGWPGQLGTPPWTAARQARFPGVRYRVRPMDDATGDARHVLLSAYRATRRGIPVPFYTGGDLSGGLGRALPRHVVMAVPPPPVARVPEESPRLHLYDPGHGMVHRVDLDDLLARRAPSAALGGWTHVSMVLLPVPA